MLNIIPLHVDDIIALRKPHPCGGHDFKVLRLGSEVKIQCLTCGHDMTLPRIKLERAIKSIIPATPTPNEGDGNP